MRNYQDVFLSYPTTPGAVKICAVNDFDEVMELPLPRLNRACGVSQFETDLTSIRAGERFSVKLEGACMGGELAFLFGNASCLSLSENTADGDSINSIKDEMADSDGDRVSRFSVNRLFVHNALERAVYDSISLAQGGVAQVCVKLKPARKLGWLPLEQKLVLSGPNMLISDGVINGAFPLTIGGVDLINYVHSFAQFQPQEALQSLNASPNQQERLSIRLVRTGKPGAVSQEEIIEQAENDEELCSGEDDDDDGLLGGGGSSTIEKESGDDDDAGV